MSGSGRLFKFFGLNVHLGSIFRNERLTMLSSSVIFSIFSYIGWRFKYAFAWVLEILLVYFIPWDGPQQVFLINRQSSASNFNLGISLISESRSGQQGSES